MDIELQVCKLGAYGKAYDMPDVKRAYTYEDQPGNPIAAKLGRALAVASREKHGDSIDQGLNLLKALSACGFGVFEVNQQPAGQEQI